LKFIKRAKPGLKRTKYHIICSWILLVCFVAGQYMVYAHQHNISNGATKTHGISKNITQQTVKEKCYLCDVMHHNAMVAGVALHVNPVKVIGHVFKSFEYSFTNIRLVLSGDRAPPLPGYLV